MSKGKSISGSAFDYALIRRTVSFAKPYKKLFYSGMLFTVLLALLAPLRPWLVQYTLDNHIATKNLQGLLQFSMLIFGVLLFESILQWLGGLINNTLAMHVVHDIRNKLYRTMLNFRVSWFDKNPVGMLVTRSTSDVQSISDVFSQGLSEILADLLKIVTIVVFMFWLHWKLALIACLTIPLLIWATAIFKNAIKHSFQDVRNQVARLNTFIQERINGILTVQTFHREEKEAEAFAAINAAHRDAHNRGVWYYSVFFPVVEILSAIAIGLVVILGAGLSRYGEVTTGMVVSFIMYVNLLYRPIRMLADRFNNLQLSMVCAERVYNLMDLQEEEKNEGSLDAKKIIGTIDFIDVKFAYTPGQEIIRGINLHVQAGERIGIVGETGSGKTTLAALLTRFYPVDEGRILLDGVSIHQYELSAFRKAVGLILQDVFLFHGSILDNIRLSDTGVSEQQVKEAVRKTGLDPFIQSLPDGLNHEVRERGVSLSAGQRQLIAFLRVAVFNPQILILDEATSNIDSETEKLITKATFELTKGRTCLIIAHRLSTIRSVDRILVMQQGNIAESGSHDNLLKQNGLYASMIRKMEKPVLQN